MRSKRNGRPAGTRAAKKVALADYRPEDWPRWLEIADDRSEWPESYPVWRGNAEAMAERLCRAGLEVVWITLEPEAFAAWCQARGYRNDGEARLRFAAEAVGNMPRPPEAAG